MSKELDRLSKILAQAENAGTPEEAETFMAKAQAVSTAIGVDLAVARMHQAKKERVQEPEERSIKVNPYERKNKTHRKQMMELAMAIADVNDVEYLISGNESFLHAVGFPSDLDVVEALLAHLSVQMVMEADAALKRGDNKSVEKVLITEKREIPFDERDWGLWDRERNRYYDPHPSEIGWGDGMTEEEYEEAIKNKQRLRTGDTWKGDGYRLPTPPPKYEEIPVLDENGLEQFEEKEISLVDGRVFRTDFYDGFITRMRGRLWESRRDAERAAGVDRKVEGNEGALALRDKKEEVQAAHKERIGVRKLGVYESSDETSRKYDHTGRGRESGTSAAGSVAIGSEGRGVKKA